MPPLYFNQLLSSLLIPALGWTFIHSLWQGGIVAIAVLLILATTRKSTPVIRYNILVVLFAVFLISIGITFSIQYHRLAFDIASQNQEPAFHSGKRLFQHMSAPLLQQSQSYFLKFENFFNTHAGLIVGIWFLIFCIQCFRLLSGVNYSYRLKRYKTFSIPAKWEQRCVELKHGLGIKKTVSIRESALVMMPVVIGFFKPFILLPLGMIINIPYQEVESILLHELAHIKRNDYLINMLQNFAEAVFFFNPAILWMSSLIKQEREACCDELAIKHLKSKTSYIEALISFGEYSLAKPEFAMAFPGDKNHLLSRVKRIINNENKKLTSMEKAILFCGVLAIAAIFIFSSKKTEVHNRIASPINEFIKKADTVPNSQNPKIPGPVTKRKHTQTKVTADVDGVNKTVSLNQTHDKEKTIKARLVNDSLTKLSVDGIQINKTGFKNYEKKVQSIDKQQAQTNAAGQQNGTQLKPRNSQAIKQETKQNKNQVAEDLIDSKKSYTKDANEETEEIIDFLKSKNIIKTKKGTTFKLTNTELIVNNLRQPENIQQVLKEKFIDQPGDFYVFSSTGDTTSITVRHD